MAWDLYDREQERLMILRLLAEGAADLFECDAQPLYQLGLKTNLQAALAFNIIGTALTEISTGLRDMQTERMQEAIGQQK